MDKSDSIIFWIFRNVSYSLTSLYRPIWQEKAHSTRNELEKRSNLVTQLQLQFKSLTATHNADKKKLVEALEKIKKYEVDISMYQNKASIIDIEAGENQKASYIWLTSSFFDLLFLIRVFPQHNWFPLK